MSPRGRFQSFNPEFQDEVSQYGKAIELGKVLIDPPKSIEEAEFSLRIIRLQNEKLKLDWVR